MTMKKGPKRGPFCFQKSSVIVSPSTLTGPAVAYWDLVSHGQSAPPSHPGLPRSTATSPPETTPCGMPSGAMIQLGKCQTPPEPASPI